MGKITISDCVVALVYSDGDSLTTTSYLTDGCPERLTESLGAAVEQALRWGCHRIQLEDEREES